MLTISVILLVFTFVGLYGGDTLPVSGMFGAMMTFLMPGVIVANLLLVLWWIIRRRIFVIIPLVALACCWRYIGTIVQLRSTPDREVVSVEKTLAVASMNVHSFDGETSGVLAQEICTMFLAEGTDVVCLQEFRDNLESQTGTTVRALMREDYPYQALGRNDMIILSRFPIRATKSFPFEYSNNSFMWADIETPDGMVRVFNVHMETTSINTTLRQASREAEAETRDEAETDTLTGAPRIQNSSVYEALAGNYMFSLIVRSGQCTPVMQERMQSPYPVILAGDLNDVPYSYTYNALLGDLEDGFRQGGHGFMFTYRGARGIFRIDYIFHNPRWECIDYYTLNRDYSDHNPVFSKLKLRD